MSFYRVSRIGIIPRLVFIKFPDHFQNSWFSRLLTTLKFTFAQQFLKPCKTILVQWLQHYRKQTNNYVKYARLLVVKYETVRSEKVEGRNRLVYLFVLQRRWEGWGGGGEGVGHGEGGALPSAVNPLHAKHNSISPNWYKQNNG